MNAHIDGQKMLTRENAFKELKRALSLPARCGTNLDALWDYLTSLGTPVTLTFSHSEDMVEALEPYGLKLLQTLIEAAIKNPNFKLSIDWEEEEDE